MLTKTIKYVDYDDNERTETCYFNLSKAEVIKWQVSPEGGMAALIERIVQEADPKKLFGLFEELIQLSYGVKSPDGRRFEKSDELTRAFMQTEAYTELFMELGTDANAGAEFVKGIFPSSLIPSDYDEQIASAITK